VLARFSTKRRKALDLMQVDRKQLVTALLLLLMLLAMRDFVAAQTPKSLVASANGDGILKVGEEEFKVTAVVVKLIEDGKAEITLISDISVFVSGTWSRGEVRNTIDLKITGAATKGGLEGIGKLVLRDDAKSIESLALHVQSNTTKRKIELSFVAK
jgi:hypothetical protein